MRGTEQEFQTRQHPCAVDSCEHSYPDHRWGAIKASDDGWFCQKDGTSWCPDHIPEWVEDWREKRGLDWKQKLGQAKRSMGDLVEFTSGRPDLISPEQRDVLKEADRVLKELRA